VYHDLVNEITLTFSLAEQNFSWTRSIGLLNLSMKMLEHLARRPEFRRLTLLSNDTFKGCLDLPAAVEVRYHNEANGRGLSRVLWDQWKVYSAAKATGNEWLFMPKGFVSFVRKCPAKLAAYVPDVMFITYYEWTCPARFNRLELLYLKQSLKAALRQAKVIFTCSEFTKAEIVQVAKIWGIQLPKLVAIGTGFTASPNASIEKQDRIVVLASTWAHKRTDLAVKYLERWQRETHYGGRVDWVGSLPQGVILPDFPRWQLHQRVAEPDYRQMLAQARALVYFSEHEGFGMPPVEAIIAGTCSVYSDIATTREVMNGAGMSFQNGSFESFAGALNTALNVSTSQLRIWERELLKRHNWENGAAKIVQALSEAGAG
jgi:hypothetical protein